jgi:UDP-GlcNAc:undecaprenyl-phosphate/decaprenyl-phosphate GlcNAc-1-phosphate transferase
MVTLLWIIGITNAFNLIDNMDGLCAGVGLVACVALAVLFAPLAQEPFLVALILAGAMAGFLIYNFHPARIFMGDCGSLVIGFSVSVVVLCYAQTPQSTQLMRFAVPTLMLLVPILDTTLVTVIRLLSGRKASTGGRDHTSHRLVLMGFSEKSAVLFLYGTGAVAGLAAVFVSRSDTMTSPAVIVPVITAIVLMGIYLSQLRVYPEKEFSVLRDRKFTPVLLELTYKRQLLLVMFDLLLVAFSYYLSYRLRFEGPEFVYYFGVFLNSLPAVIACKLLVFYVMGIYRGMWGYLSTNDVFLYVRASFAGTLLSVVAVTFIYRFEDFSKGIFFIDWLLTTALLLGARGSFRLFVETQNRKTLSGDRGRYLWRGQGRGVAAAGNSEQQTSGSQTDRFRGRRPLEKGPKDSRLPDPGHFR